MNAADVIGWACDGALYCNAHAPDEHDADCWCGDCPAPVFADDADEDDVCDVPHDFRENGSPLFERLFDCW